MTRVLAASLLFVACRLDVNGVGVTQAGGPGADATLSDSGAGASLDEDGAGQADDANDAIDASDANTSVDAGDANASIDAGDAALSSLPNTSCKTLLAANPSAFGKNGLYAIDPDGEGTKPPFVVYCEMSLDGGGWTLVGRSAPQGAPPFGWTTSTGTVSNMASPYSLDVATAGLAFTEVLLAQQAANSLDAGSRAYKVSVPADFVTKYLDAAVSTTPVTILGMCNSVGGGPTMLTHAGGTSVTDSFFFRDNATFDDPNLRFGLLARGFDTYYSNCPQGADLKGQQGLIFVR